MVVIGRFRPFENDVPRNRGDSVCSYPGREILRTWLLVPIVHSRPRGEITEFGHAPALPLLAYKEGTEVFQIRDNTLAS